MVFRKLIWGWLGVALVTPLGVTAEPQIAEAFSTPYEHRGQLTLGVAMGEISSLGLDISAVKNFSVGNDTSGDGSENAYHFWLGAQGSDKLGFFGAEAGPEGLGQQKVNFQASGHLLALAPQGIMGYLADLDRGATQNATWQAGASNSTLQAVSTVGFDGPVISYELLLRPDHAVSTTAASRDRSTRNR